MLSGVPKPWTSGSTSTKTWAPIRPVFKAPAADAAAERASKHESSASIAATGEESWLEQALDNLDTILDELPPPPTPIKQETNVVTMSSSAAAIKKANNNNNNNSVEMVDDLTKQLVRALDTNDVVGWKSSEESPFGNCAACGISIDGEASVVGKIHYHPNCFSCAECRKPLGTTKYFIIGGKNYCSEDRLKFLETCAKCDKIIENETIRPKESGKPYHADCFCCIKCAKPLQGKYFTTENGMLCEEDFADSRDKCGRCGRPIMESTLKALGQVYHPNCFVCSMCPRSLDGTEFFVTEDNKPMCKEDFAKFMAKTCDGCNKKIIDETLISSNGGKYFHRECYNN